MIFKNSTACKAGGIPVNFGGGGAFVREEVFSLKQYEFCYIVCFIL